jgi:hypothetical protein
LKIRSGDEKRSDMQVQIMRRATRWSLYGLGLALAAWGVFAMSSGWQTILIERGWSLFIAGAALLSGGAVVLALGCVVSRLDALLGAGGARAETAAAPPTAPEPMAAREKSRETALSPKPVPAPAVASTPVAAAPASAPAAPASFAPPPRFSEERPEAPTREAAALLWDPAPAEAPKPEEPPILWDPVSKPAEAPPKPPLIEKRGFPPPPVLARPGAPKRVAPPPADGSAASVEVDRYVSGDVTYVMYSDGAVEVRTQQGAQRFASLAELRAHAAQQL